MCFLSNSLIVDNNDAGGIETEYCIGTRYIEWELIYKLYIHTYNNIYKIIYKT